MLMAASGLSANYTSVRTVTLHIVAVDVEKATKHLKPNKSSGIENVFAIISY
jgi:hypothetical protein